MTERISHLFKQVSDVHLMVGAGGTIASGILSVSAWSVLSLVASALAGFATFLYMCTKILDWAEDRWRDDDE